MDQRFRDFPASMNGIQVGNQSISYYHDQNLSGGPRFRAVYTDQNIENGNRLQNLCVNDQYYGGQCFPSESLSSNITSSSNHAVDDDCDEDCDFSDAGLRYITKMLMEEDMEEKSCMLQDSLELQAKEKSFYEVLGEQYPPLPEITGGCISRNGQTHEDFMSGNHCDRDDSRLIPACNASNSSVSMENSATTVIDRFLDSDPLGSPLQSSDSSDTYSEIQSISNFKKGVEDASKFLPSGDNFFQNVELSGLYEGEYLPTGLTARRNRYVEDVDSEEDRSRKQAAISTDSTVRSEEFDIILLNSMGKGEAELRAYREKLQDATSKKTQHNGQSRGKKRSGKKEVIDLSTLLISCAQATAADDRRLASELLIKIRQHSSPLGDGNQRLAHYFADGLEARVAGIGSQIYRGLMSKVGSAADFIKAYHLYLASSPFRRISNFASNKTTMIKAEKATKVHVIDFGILYGFQWPTFIQRLAAREGGPPKLRMTGIEFPQPGFRPAERIEETGQRLADYARTFHVPFEYNAIAKNWETITIDDLKIDKDELLVVNSVYRFKNLHDETDNARNVVLKLIREIKPSIFVHGIVNGAYGAPYFITRFREALFHYSSIFDMLETNVPREVPERLLIEREIFGREAMNVIACEGRERVERPETYKQWQVLHQRAGLKQVPFERYVMNKAIQKVTSSYHKDFLIDEDGKWMLLGWKGRIIYALSCWKSV